MTNADVVFIGGGPVALWTAILTRTLSGKSITVFEKYPQYLRSHQLHINENTFTQIPELAKKWGGKLVPIQEIENELSRRAQALGIQIIKGYEANPDTLAQLFPKAIFVGADGARSIVRQKIALGNS